MAIGCLYTIQIQPYRYCYAVSVYYSDIALKLRRLPGLRLCIAVDTCCMNLGDLRMRYCLTLCEFTIISNFLITEKYEQQYFLRGQSSISKLECLQL